MVRWDFAHAAFLSHRTVLTSRGRETPFLHSGVLTMHSGSTSLFVAQGIAASTSRSFGEGSNLGRVIFIVFPLRLMIICRPTRYSFVSPTFLFLFLFLLSLTCCKTPGSDPAVVAAGLLPDEFCLCILLFLWCVFCLYEM